MQPGKKCKPDSTLIYQADLYYSKIGTEEKSVVSHYWNFGECLKKLRPSFGYGEWWPFLKKRGWSKGTVKRAKRIRDRHATVGKATACKTLVAACGYEKYEANELLLHQAGMGEDEYEEQQRTPTAPVVARAEKPRLTVVTPEEEPEPTATPQKKYKPEPVATPQKKYKDIPWHSFEVTCRFFAPDKEEVREKLKSIGANRITIK